MEEFIEQLIAKTGLDRGMAEKVVDFIKENTNEIPKLLGNNFTDKIPGQLGDMVSGFLNSDKKD
jgi:hypothetical protein